MIKSVGLVPVCLRDGKVCLLLGQKRLDPGAGTWTGPSQPFKGADSEAFLRACEAFSRQVWTRIAPVQGTTEGWEPWGAFDAGWGLLGRARWFLVKLPAVPKALDIRFTDRDRMRLGAYTGNWPFGLADFKDLKWIPLEELPKPLWLPQDLVKAASRLTPRDFDPTGGEALRT